jgi:hypothetical protein
MTTASKKPAKKAAKKKPRRPPSRLVRPNTDIMPPAQAGQSATPAERQAFAAMVACGTPQRTAYMHLRPYVEPTTAASISTKWAADMAAEIADLKEAASQAAGQAHGVTVAWLVGNMKEMFETPLADIDAKSRFCKKYRITETMTDAGPKTTIEVEKPCPLATLLAISKQTGLDATPIKQPEEEGPPTIKSLMAALVKPGSPIARRLAEGRAS